MRESRHIRGSLCLFRQRKSPAVAGGAEIGRMGGRWLFYLFFSALLLMALPAEDRSLPAPSVVLHALNATPALARISIATIAFMKLLRIVGLPFLLFLPAPPANLLR
jgi:hypothetical protein